MEKNNKVSLDTMTGIGKTKKIAGREYTILPVNIKDMHYILGDGLDEENALEKMKEEGYVKPKTLIIPDSKLLEDPENVNWQLFGLNIIDEDRKKIFLDVINNYVFYKGFPMTEELLIEHNWSFKEIGEFLFAWCQISD